MPTSRTPVLFIHGLWLHASSWQPCGDRHRRRADQGRAAAFHAAVTLSTLKQYRGSTAVTDLVEFADRGHSLTIDSGWRAVADECLAWLAKEGL